MAKRPEEMRYYREQYERIERLNDASEEEIVVFDPHGADMEEWYQEIGIVISVSDFESFHLTLADGAASGADAVSLAWDGSDLIYPAPCFSRMLRAWLPVSSTTRSTSVGDRT